ncbi:MAG: MFS transporter [Chloroflexi bacterium]|nr:MFS transporter [Chloroflexota bacterium]
MLADYWRKMRLFNRQTWIALVVIAVAAGIVFSGVWTVLNNLYLLRLGYGPEFVGKVAAVMLATQALVSLPAGGLAMALGLRRCLIAALLVLAAAGLAYAAAGLVPASWRQPYVLAAAGLVYAGGALFTTALVPLLVGSTGATERPHALALSLAFMSAGGVLGSLVGGQLPGLFARLGGLDPAHPRPYGLGLAAAFLLIAPVVWLASRLPEPPRSAREQAAARGTAPYGLFVMIGLISLLRCAGEMTARTFYPVYADQALGIRTAQIGATMSLGMLLAVPAPLLMPLLVQRLGRLGALILSVLGATACVAVMGLGGPWPLFAAAYVLLIGLATVARSAWMLLGQEVVAPEWRPMSSAAGNLGSGLGAAALSAAGGYMAAALGYGPLYGASAASVALGALTIWLCFGRRRRRAAVAAV